MSEVKSIPIQLTWQNTLPMLIAVLQSGDAEGRDFAKKELMKLAKGMDDLNASGIQQKLSDAIKESEKFYALWSNLAKQTETQP